MYQGCHMPMGSRNKFAGLFTLISLAMRKDIEAGYVAPYANVENIDTHPIGT